MEIAKFFGSGGDSRLDPVSEIFALAPKIQYEKGKDLLRKITALLRFHFKIDPDQLTDKQFAELWQQLKYALHFEDIRVSVDGKKSKIDL